MKEEKAFSIILDPRTINIVGGPGLVGALKSAFRGINVAQLTYPFDISCLPQKRDKEEFDRCNKIGQIKLSLYYKNRFIDAYTGYERVIVWHDNTAYGALLMGLICMTENRPIFEVNTDKKFVSKYGHSLTMGGLSVEQFKLSTKFLKPITESQKNKYVRIYKRFSPSENELKINVNGKILPLSQSRLLEIKREIIRRSAKPVSVYNPIGCVMGKWQDYHFGTSAYMSIIMDMINDGQLFVTNILLDKRTPISDNPFGKVRGPKIMFEGHNLEEAVKIKITSSKKFANINSDRRCLNFEDVRREIAEKSDTKTMQIFDSLMVPHSCSYRNLNKIMDVALKSSVIKSIALRGKEEDVLAQYLGFLENPARKLVGTIISIADKRDLSDFIEFQDIITKEIRITHKCNDVFFTPGPWSEEEFEVEILVIAFY